MTIHSYDFEYMRELLRSYCGIVLEADKEYLIEGRLSPLAEEEGFGKLDNLLARIRTTPFNSLHQKVIEAMVTTETSFFRDFHPFELLKDVVLPEIMTKRAGERKINIWSNACASGQEPYSVAMLLDHYCHDILKNWDVQIFASDISAEMLARAQEGKYNQVEVNRGLPTAFLLKYFAKKGPWWQLHENIRAMVNFRQINLVETWSSLPQMDIIFMRNVLIYFDVATKKKVLQKVRRLLKPDAYLFLGGAETTIYLDKDFEGIFLGKNVLYRPVDGAK